MRVMRFKKKVISFFLFFFITFMSCAATNSRTLPPPLPPPFFFFFFSCCVARLGQSAKMVMPSPFYKNTRRRGKLPITIYCFLPSSWSRRERYNWEVVGRDGYTIQHNQHHTETRRLALFDGLTTRERYRRAHLCHIIIIFSPMQMGGNCVERNNARRGPTAESLKKRKNLLLLLFFF